jgi:hypothetical protein
MKTALYTAIFLSVILVLNLGCEKEIPTNDNMDSETWTCVADSGKGSGNWIFTQKDNKDIYVSGEWTYTFDSDTVIFEVKCPFTNGLASVFGEEVSFVASGTATIVNDPGNSSLFSLNVWGFTNNGNGTGEFSITFTEPAWPPKKTGIWTGTRTGGAGITE